jgi:hypothetical protein
MRLAPYIFAVALIAIRVPEGHLKLSRMLALAGLAFFAVRTIGTATSLYLYDARFDRELAALDHLPVGARVVSFVGRPCDEEWAVSRLHHLSALATLRRNAFSNDQWTMAGAQLLGVHYPGGGRFVRDPSQIVTDERCGGETWLTLDQSLRRLPRAAFDFIWVIDAPPHDPALTAGLTPVWRDGPSVLYRIDRAAGPNPPAPLL